MSSALQVGFLTLRKGLVCMELKCLPACDEVWVTNIAVRLPQPDQGTLQAWVEPSNKSWKALENRRQQPKYEISRP
eukprot:1696540-Amphidinium_carterae.1